MKTNWKQLTFAVLVYAVPAGIIAALVNAAGNSGGPRLNAGDLSMFTGFGNETDGLSGARTAAVLVGGLLSALIGVLLQPYVQGAITRLVASSYLGREMTAKEALLGVRKLWLSFVGATILVGFAIAGGLIAVIVGAVAVWALFTAVIPVIAIEEEGAFNAMGRSWALMKTRFWSYLGTRVLLLIISSLLAFAVVLIPTLLAEALRGTVLDPLGWVIYAAGSIIGEIVVFPITAIAATLIYFDSRVRNEGFDVQFMAARLPSGPTDSQSPSGPA